MLCRRAVDWLTEDAVAANGYLGIRGGARDETRQQEWLLDGLDVEQLIEHVPELIHGDSRQAAYTGVLFRVVRFHGEYNLAVFDVNVQCTRTVFARNVDREPGHGVR